MKTLANLIAVIVLAAMVVGGAGCGGGSPLVFETDFEDGRIQAQWQSEINPDEPAWFRCDVRDADDRYLAVTIPVFTGPRRGPSLHRFGDFLD